MSTKKKLLICFLSAVVLILYLCLGSLLFVAIEQPYMDQNQSPQINNLQQLLSNIELIRTLLNSSTITANLTHIEGAIEVLEETQGITYQLLISEYQSILPWNFFTGIHFCLTAITTIGKYNLVYSLKTMKRNRPI